MKRIVTWLLSTITVVVLLFGYHTSTSGPGTTTSQTAIVSESPSASAATSSPRSSSTASPSAKPSSATSTGSVAHTRWGPVQVKITVSAGKITKVSVLQYPSGNSTDQQINSYALPILVKNTIDAQSANIDMISGATVTSNGYRQSLQSALDQAAL